MKTDVVLIYGDLGGHDEALTAAKRFAAYHGITGKQEMHLRLLTEETLSMLHSIFDKFRGNLWLESEETKKGLLCRICLTAESSANREQEVQILSVSSSGKNEHKKGIIGKIREAFRRGMQLATAEDEQYLQNMSDAWLGMTTSGADFGTGDAPYWSYQHYRAQLEQSPEKKTQEWDELEKLIIVKLSDEVRVRLSQDTTEIYVEKVFSGTDGE